VVPFAVSVQVPTESAVGHDATTVPFVDVQLLFAFPEPVYAVHWFAAALLHAVVFPDPPVPPGVVEELQPRTSEAPSTVANRIPVQ
jgi:hypothetical protein